MTDKEIFIKFWEAYSNKQVPDFTTLPERYQPVVQKYNAVIERNIVYTATPEWKQHQVEKENLYKLWRTGKITPEEYDKLMYDFTDGPLCDLVNDFIESTMEAFPCNDLTVEVAPYVFTPKPLPSEVDPMEACEASFTLISSKILLSVYRVAFNPNRVPAFTEFGKRYNKAILAG